VPAGWERYAFWQFSDRGQVPGVGNCDLDVFLGTEAELRALGKPGAPQTPPVTPEVTPVNPDDADFDALWSDTEHLARLEHTDLAVRMQQRIAALKARRAA
jgi:hypothetical protein